MNTRKDNEVNYVPAIATKQITARHTMGRVPIAEQGAPQCICGVAKRIGYTGPHDSDLAIYRLKVKAHTSDNATTLPTLYVVDGGLFVDYDEWRQKHNVLQD